MSGEKKRCAGRFHRSGMLRSAQCERRATIGDYCKQHHPDTIKAKNETQQAKWDAKSGAYAKAARIRAAEREVIRQAKALNHGDIDLDALLDAVRALEKEEEK